MLICLALLGQANAQSIRFVDDAPAVEAAIDAAPTSGAPDDYLVVVLPGVYAIDRRDIDGRRMELRALVPGTVTFRRNNNDRIFNVRGAADVVFDGIDFDGEGQQVFLTGPNADANLTIRRSVFEDGGGNTSGRGGFITHDTTGILRLDQVEFRAATANQDGGQVRAAGGTLDVHRSRFVGGSADRHGGCVSAENTAVTLDHVQFEACDAGVDGGALHIRDAVGTASLDAVWFERNNADRWGGGLWANDTLDVTGSLFCRGTSATRSTGGLYVDAAPGAAVDVAESIFLNNGSVSSFWSGGGLRVVGGDALTSVGVDRSSFVGNIAFDGGAMLFNLTNGGVVDVVDSQFAYHSSFTVAQSLDSFSSRFQGNTLHGGLFVSGFDVTSNNAIVDPGFPQPSATSCDPSLIVPTAGNLGAFEFGFLDADGDGHYAPVDCDDDPLTGASIHPGAVEICDGVDNDCDFRIDEDIVSAASFYLDRDGDGVGGDSVVGACRVGPFVVDVGGDCDDDDPASITGPDHYPDADGDGFGDENAVGEASCAPIVGTVIDNTDCDDADPSVNPGDDEICDGVDNDCDGAIDEPGPFVTYVTWYVDSDGDGYGRNANTVAVCDGSTPVGYALQSGDCQDLGSEAATQYPGNPEVCDGRDNDCANGVDDGLPLTTYHLDADNDQYGDPGFPLVTCGGAPANHVLNAEDCDDAEGSTNPDGTEVCDGDDNDCDGQVDEASAPGITYTTWFLDADGDTFGDPLTVTETCDGMPSAGYVGNDQDCNDDPLVGLSVNPAEPEICDGLDNNCDGQTDEASPTSTYTTWFRDQDGDGYGDPLDTTTTCDGSIPDGYVANDQDCDDSGPDAALRHPGNVEICDGIDNDCDEDGLVDDGLPLTWWWSDADGDGVGAGDAADGVDTCDDEPPDDLVAWVQVFGDCVDDQAVDPLAPLVFPGAVEFCDGVDNDCDGDVDEDAIAAWFHPDADQDGFGDPGFGAVETCTPPTGWVANAFDCDDTRANVSPVGQDDTCDQLDNDCDGVVDDDVALVDAYADADGDGFGVGAPSAVQCPGDDLALTGDDCDDTDPTVNPAAVDDDCDGLDDDCDLAIDEDASSGPTPVDADGDGFVTAGPEAQCADPLPPTDERDCDDAAADVYPGAPPTVCDVDADCDGVVDNEALDCDEVRPATVTPDDVSTYGLACQSNGAGTGTALLVALAGLFSRRRRDGVERRAGPGAHQR